MPYKTQVYLKLENGLKPSAWEGGRLGRIVSVTVPEDFSLQQQIIILVG